MSYLDEIGLNQLVMKLKTKFLMPSSFTSRRRIQVGELGTEIGPSNVLDVYFDLSDLVTPGNKILTLDGYAFGASYLHVASWYLSNTNQLHMWIRNVTSSMTVPATSRVWLSWVEIPE